MPKYFVLTIPVQELYYHTDMLRHDLAYDVSRKGDTYKFQTLRFTPSRWGEHLPEVQNIVKINSRELNERELQAEGFITGIRLAQDLLGEYLVQGSVRV